MVVVTRSRYRSRSHANSSSGVFTSSLRETSMRSYKIYSGNTRKSPGGSAPEPVPEPEESVEYEYEYEPEGARSESDADAAAANSLTELSDADAAAANSLTELKFTNKHACMNPMHPVTNFMYRIQVFNNTRTMHYKTAFIGYNTKTRLFYVHTIISNCYCESSEVDYDAHTHGCYGDGLPLPVNTLQVKYSSYLHENIENYIMTILIPSKDYNYYIQDDILGVAISDAEFCEMFESDSSSYYDVDRLVHDTNATQTVNGFKTFQLIPSRNYWFDPVVPESRSSGYSSDTINSVLNILSHSR